MVVELSTAGIDMNDVGVFIGWTIVKRLTGRDKLKRGIACAAESHQNPDCCQAIEIRSEMPHNGGQLLHSDESRFPDLPGVSCAGMQEAYQSNWKV
jgi:hypothetical protein